MQRESISEAPCNSICNHQEKEQYIEPKNIGEASSNTGDSPAFDFSFFVSTGAVWGFTGCIYASPCYFGDQIHQKGYGIENQDAADEDNYGGFENMSVLHSSQSTRDIAETTNCSYDNCRENGEDCYDLSLE